MECKTFEVRDVATMIPVLATRLCPSCEQDRYLISRAGYGAVEVEQGDFILLAKLSGGGGTLDCCYDPVGWAFDLGRTMRVAHQYLVDSLIAFSPAAEAWVKKLGYAPRTQQMEWIQKVSRPLWEVLPSGLVIDVEYILGESGVSKYSESISEW